MFYLGNQTASDDHDKLKDGQTWREASGVGMGFTPNINITLQYSRAKLKNPALAQSPPEHHGEVARLIIDQKPITLDVGSVITVLPAPEKPQMLEFDFEGMSQDPVWLQACLESVQSQAGNIPIATYGNDLMGYAEGMDDAWFKVPPKDFKFDTVMFNIHSTHRTKNPWIEILDVIGDCAYFGHPKNDEATLNGLINRYRAYRKFYPTKKLMPTILGWVESSWNDGVEQPVNSITLQRQASIIQRLHVDPQVKLYGAFIWGMKRFNRELASYFGVDLK